MNKQYTLDWRTSAARNQRGDIFSGYWQVHDTNGNVICDIYGETGKQDEDSGDDVFLPDAEIREIAHLIAAAPDLLALLEKIDSLMAEWKNLNYINYGKMQSRFDEDLERVELEIEEAIAAAKGEA